MELPKPGKSGGVAALATSTKPGEAVLGEVAGGYQIRTRPDKRSTSSACSAPPPPQPGRLETLAVVAYYKPITRTDIEHIRGVDCGGVLRMLLERKLIRVLGRKEIPGRPMIYETTKFFLELFDLKDLKDLPTLKEIEALGATTPDENVPTTRAADDDEVQSQATEQTAGQNSEGPRTDPHTTTEP